MSTHECNLIKITEEKQERSTFKSDHERFCFAVYNLQLTKFSRPILILKLTNEMKKGKDLWFVVNCRIHSVDSVREKKQKIIQITSNGENFFLVLLLVFLREIYSGVYTLQVLSFAYSNSDYAIARYYELPLES